MDRCGSMQLEKIMYDFINGEIDVLVSTTIIETGLDISNVNTMIIHDADRLGTVSALSAPWTCRDDPTVWHMHFYCIRRDKLLKEDSREASGGNPGIYRSWVGI